MPVCPIFVSKPPQIGLQEIRDVITLSQQEWILVVIITLALISIIPNLLRHDLTAILTSVRYKGTKERQRVRNQG